MSALAKSEALPSVKDFLGKKNKKGDQGLELEVEADEQLPDIDTQHWKTKLEGSLRGSNEGRAKEYVSNGVLDAGDVSRALNFLAKKLEDPKLKVKQNSPRTSFHVHNNVLSLTPVNVWTATTAFWLCENPLYNLCGNNRKGNLFCLRLRDAEGVIGHCIRDLRRDLPFASLSSVHIRYAGQNLAGITKFGSVEYRGMEGTTDSDRLNEWASNLHLLTKNAASKYANPAALMDSYYAQGADAFLDSLFSSEFSSKLKTGRYLEEMEENEGILCELAYFHSWDEWEKKINKNLKERKEVKEQDWVEIDDEPAIPPARPDRLREMRMSLNALQNTRPAAPAPSFWAVDTATDTYTVNTGVTTRG